MGPSGAGVSTGLPRVVAVLTVLGGMLHTCWPLCWALPVCDLTCSGQHTWEWAPPPMFPKTRRHLGVRGAPPAGRRKKEASRSALLHRVDSQPSVHQRGQGGLPDALCGRERGPPTGQAARKSRPGQAMEGKRVQAPPPEGKAYLFPLFSCI
ncbi:hypothetical protein HJG60_011658 [Phyllostomus discolor]|uniref:Uncharacterized protein n=1 Tax=Phyllostomus discolor TaxID=89673 RepID=A0A833ZN54_9CHIR|nr:hypothetical protein HJG60_011658 [Phyllostomus discolor]